MSLQCEVCGKSEGAILTCGMCHTEHYCSKNCQRQHWKQHKQICMQKLTPLADIDFSDTILAWSSVTLFNGTPRAYFGRVLMAFSGFDFRTISIIAGYAECQEFQLVKLNEPVNTYVGLVKKEVPPKKSDVRTAMGIARRMSAKALCMVVSQGVNLAGLDLSKHSAKDPLISQGDPYLLIILSSALRKNSHVTDLYILDQFDYFDPFSSSGSRYIRTLCKEAPQIKMIDFRNSDCRHSETEIDGVRILFSIRETTSNKHCYTKNYYRRNEKRQRRNRKRPSRCKDY